jgi:hypothetical protein
MLKAENRLKRNFQNLNRKHARKERINCLAQEDGRSLDRKLKFIKEGRIELPEVTRNYEKVTYDVPQQELTAQKYSFTIVQAEVGKLPMNIKIRTLSPPELKKLYGNYVRAGFGNYSTPYLEGSFNSKRSDKYNYGAHLRQFSSALGPIKYSKTGETILEGYGTYFLPKTAVDGKLLYQRNRYNYYGFNHAIPPEVDQDTIKQVFNTVSAQVGLRNTDPRAKTDYAGGLKYWYFKGREVTENEVAVDAQGNHKLDEEKSVDVNLLYAYSTRNATGKLNRSFFQLRPAFIFKRDKYKITGGLNFAFGGDTAVERKFHVYPRIKGEYQVLEGELTAFAGIDGELQKNTLRTFANENPWIDVNTPLIHTNKSLEIFGGIKGNVLEKLNYKARIAYQNYKYLYFYMNNSRDTSRFDIVYDSTNTGVFNFLAAVSYDFTEKYRIGLNANYYNYNTGTLAKAYHRPAFDLSVLSTYNIYKKIYFNLDIFYISGLYAVNSKNKEVKLSDIIDLNATIDYKFSDSFSAFIQANNIISKKYQRYLNYPVKGINILAGVSYTF